MVWFAIGSGVLRDASIRFLAAGFMLGLCCRVDPPPQPDLLSNTLLKGQSRVVPWKTLSPKLVWYFFQGSELRCKTLALLQTKVCQSDEVYNSLLSACGRAEALRYLRLSAGSRSLMQGS